MPIDQNKLRSMAKVISHHPIKMFQREGQIDLYSIYL